MKHPIQPIEKDSLGVLRFRKNEIVRFLLDSGQYDLNDLALRGFDRGDWEQFAQLIGYSIGGFSELAYVSKETMRRVDDLAKCRHRDKHGRT